MQRRHHDSYSEEDYEDEVMAISIGEMFADDDSSSTVESGGQQSRIPNKKRDFK